MARRTLGRGWRLHRAASESDPSGDAQDHQRRQDAVAADAFRAFYRLAELRAQAKRRCRSIDVLIVPTAPAAYTVAEIAADPIALNSKLGTYTNFVNLLDLAGLAVPAAFAADGTPFGVTLLAPAGQDALLASVGRVFHPTPDCRSARSSSRPHRPSTHFH